ncbi:MAG: CPBP family intramembrane metalloprotease [Planctomycetes bacterium]|nr:CPBP family intramembrane metalloprotease [Planctomycetota bacterium]
MSESAPDRPLEPGREHAPAPRSWPADRPLLDAEAIAVVCRDCQAPWRVHRSLAGFRLQCHCGAWIEVPPPAGALLPAPPPSAAPAKAGRELGRPTLARGELIELPDNTDDASFAPVATDLPLAPGALRHQSPSNQARWSGRTVLEFVAILVALLGPQLAALLLSRGDEFELLLPAATVASFVLVALVVAFAAPYGRIGLRGAAPRYFGEAVLAAAVALGAASLWVLVLREAFPDADADAIEALTRQLGVPLTLFVVAFGPAVLEEVTFRGVLQGRLLALLGTRVGLVVTAAAFALCHGQPALLPVHFGLGLYFGWLCLRAHSLLPGMLTHFLYNGAIVVAGIG